MFKCEPHIKQFSTENNNIFWTSDTHFLHKNILTYCKRPFTDIDDMTEQLINNWNSVVKENDIVFHLGDFMFGNVNRFWEIRSRLNGKIYLIHGNHDYKLINEGNIGEGFEEVTAQMKITVNGQIIYMNHFPLLTFDGIYKEKPAWQLFGHVHSGPKSISADIIRLKNLFPTQYDVGVDNNNYTPVSFEELQNIITRRMEKPC